MLDKIKQFVKDKPAVFWGGVIAVVLVLAYLLKSLYSGGSSAGGVVTSGSPAPVSSGSTGGQNDSANNSGITTAITGSMQFMSQALESGLSAIKEQNTDMLEGLTAQNRELFTSMTTQNTDLFNRISSQNETVLGRFMEQSRELTGLFTGAVSGFQSALDEQKSSVDELRASMSEQRQYYQNRYNEGILPQQPTGGGINFANMDLVNTIISDGIYSAGQGDFDGLGGIDYAVADSRAQLIEIASGGSRNLGGSYSIDFN